ncbi:protein FAM32A-like [Denticeps clupeoides]|uniref:Protein FAM32A n=1 Tax=Denticeps clupeoides TaxID=299321 RepID=A0AAY4D8T7_9TELE|nr:protein FAM32A [Denticeps clupeoides]
MMTMMMMNFVAVRPFFIPVQQVALMRISAAVEQKRRRRRAGNMADYDNIQKGSLKLKGAGDMSSGKKKKKKDKAKKHLESQMSTPPDKEESKTGYVDKRTPAQLAFDKIQEKRQMERILKKASKTHKRRVEDFNRHLDTLTEHYDIPKVSWTK